MGIPDPRSGLPSNGSRAHFVQVHRQHTHLDLKKFHELYSRPRENVSDCRQAGIPDPGLSWVHHRSASTEFHFVGVGRPAIHGSLRARHPDPGLLLRRSTTFSSPFTTGMGRLPIQRSPAKAPRSQPRHPYSPKTREMQSVPVFIVRCGLRKVSTLFSLKKCTLRNSRLNPVW